MRKEIAVVYTVGETEIKLTPKIVTEYLTGGANITMPEFKMFTELCKSRGLNPFLKEAYIIKYGNSPAQIVVGKDAILKRAILHPQFDGREQGIIVIDKDGKVVHRKGTFKLDSDTLAGGWATVYRKDWKYPLDVTVAFNEVAQTKRDGQLNQQWATKGPTMVEKVALVRSLREAFIEDTSGMYDADEMGVELPEVTINQEPEQVEEEVIEQNDALENDIMDIDEI